MKTFKKYCLFPIFLCSFHNPIIQDVANEYRKLYSDDERLQIRKIESINQGNEVFENPSQYALLEQIFKIIDSSKYSEVLTSNNVINPQIYHGLNFFSGSLTKPNEIFVERLKKTQTLSGKIVLSLFLANPTKDVNVLKKRKEFLSFLLQNKDVCEKIRKSLAIFKKLEASVVSLFSYGDSLYSRGFFEKLYKDFYFSKNNWRAPKLEFKKRITKNFLEVELPLLYKLLLPLSYTISQNSIWRNPIFKKYVWFSSIPFFSIFYKIYFFNSSDFLKINTDTKINNFFSYAERIGHELFYIKSIIGAINNYRIYDTQINTLFKRMDDVRNFIKVIKSLQNISTRSDYQDLQESTTFINSFFSKAKENFKMRTMLQYLEKLPQESFSFFFNNTGNLLACFDIFGDNIHSFDEIFYEIGLLDAYISMVTLILESQNEKNSFCLCEFLEEDQPSLQITGLWNPFLDPKIAVSNDVNLNLENEKTVIVTGPNAGGKSSYIKGILYNAILAQTFGVGIAKKISLTPFSKILAYLNAADKISSDNGKSLFTANVIDTRDFLQNSDDNLFSLSVFDEMFSGTNPQIAEALEFSTVEYINDKFKNNLTVLSTHKYLTTTLDSNKNVKNYRVYITKDPNDKIIYNYKIISGVSTQRIGIDILRQNGYKDEIIYKALKICKKNSSEVVE